VFQELGVKPIGLGLGWLRGEREHCKMAAIPTVEEQDAKRPHFNPKLKKATDRLQHVRTPEGEPIPLNTLSELGRDMQCLRLVREQIREIERARLECLKRAPNVGQNAMVLLLARVIEIDDHPMAHRCRERTLSTTSITSRPRATCLVLTSIGANSIHKLLAWNFATRKARLPPLLTAHVRHSTIIRVSAARQPCAHDCTLRVRIRPRVSEAGSDARRR
jgi:hypothetical protein